MSAFAPTAISPLGAPSTLQQLFGIPGISGLLPTAGLFPFQQALPSVVTPAAATQAIAGNLTAFTAGLEVGAVIGASVANNLLITARAGVPSAVPGIAGIPGFGIAGIPGLGVSGIPGLGVAGIPGLGVSGISGLGGLGGSSGLGGLGGISGLGTVGGVPGLSAIPGVQTGTLSFTG